MLQKTPRQYSKTFIDDQSNFGGVCDVFPQVLPLNAAESPLIVLDLRMLTPNLEKLNSTSCYVFMKWDGECPSRDPKSSHNMKTPKTYSNIKKPTQSPLHPPCWTFRISQSFWMVSIFVPSLTLQGSSWKYKPPDCSYCTWFDPQCHVLWRCSDDPKEEDQRHHVATDGVCKVYTCLSE